LELALSLAREIVEISDRSTTGTFQVLGYRFLGMTQYLMGQNREALDSLQQAERYRDPNRQKLLGYQFGQDPILSILSAQVLQLAHLGLVEQAARVSDELRAELPRHDHVPTVAASMILGVVSLDSVLDDLEACERHSAELVAYCGEKI